MGACLSLDADEQNEREWSDHLDKKLNIWKKQEENVIKILLLGAGESGKSTLVKQMKIIHSGGFSSDELLTFKRAVLDNLMGSMQFVLRGMGMLRINLHNAANKANAQIILNSERFLTQHDAIMQHIADALFLLWQDHGVRRAISRGYEFQLNDSAIYYFENMVRLCHPSYIPTPNDVLRARIRTTSIIETCFQVHGMIFRLIDIGGQRTERSKWIWCFDDVKALLFVVALSGYDMTLLEDSTVNRLEESLKLFRSVCNNRFFIHTSLILFLNKLDLFRDKILHSRRHLRLFFPSYPGLDCDVDAAAIYIQHLFTSHSTHSAKVIYPHFTTATDTSNVEVVFQVVMDSIIRENMKDCALL